MNHQQPQSARGVIVGHNDSANFDVLFDDDSPKYAGLKLNCHPSDVELDGPFAVGEAQSGASAETSERWRGGLEAIVCPYCETEMDDSDDWGMPDANWAEVGQCPHCEKEFCWERDVSPRYSVAKMVGEASEAPATEPRSQGDSPAENDPSSATREETL